MAWAMIIFVSVFAPFYLFERSHDAFWIALDLQCGRRHIPLSLGPIHILRLSRVASKNIYPNN
jgi:hypothetical protein